MLEAATPSPGCFRPWANDIVFGPVLNRQPLENVAQPAEDNGEERLLLLLFSPNSNGKGHFLTVQLPCREAASPTSTEKSKRPVFVLPTLWWCSTKFSKYQSPWGINGSYSVKEGYGLSWGHHPNTGLWVIWPKVRCPEWLVAILGCTGMLTSVQRSNCGVVLHGAVPNQAGLLNQRRRCKCNIQSREAHCAHPSHGTSEGQEQESQTSDC